MSNWNNEQLEFRFLKSRLESEILIAKNGQDFWAKDEANWRNPFYEFAPGFKVMNLNSKQVHANIAFSKHKKKICAENRKYAEKQLIDLLNEA